MIKTKEDFQGNYIELPKTIKKETFDEIKQKFQRLHFDTCFLDKVEYKDYFPKNDIIIYVKQNSFQPHTCDKESIPRTECFLKITLKEFLEDERNENRKQRFLRELREETIKELEEKLEEQVGLLNQMISMTFLDQKIEFSSSEIVKMSKEFLIFTLKESMKIIEKGEK